MKRRDFNRVALGIGLSPMLSDRSLAQWYEGSSPPTQPPPQKFNIVIKHSPRTYNQVNVPRKSAAGRRFTIYWTWVREIIVESAGSPHISDRSLPPRRHAAEHAVAPD
jgi:hypothetical protein